MFFYNINILFSGEVIVKREFIDLGMLFDLMLNFLSEN